MGNYSYLSLPLEVTVEHLLDTLQEINYSWFCRKLDILVNGIIDNDNYIYQIYGYFVYPFNFQIWLSKGDNRKIIYHPNVQLPDISILEEFIAMKIKEKLGGDISYEI